MNNKQIRRRLSRAAAHAAPDVFENILLNCEAREGARQDMQIRAFAGDLNPVFAPRRAEKVIRRTRGLAAAVTVMVLLLAAAVQMSLGYFAVDSVVGIDVNPSLELRTNSADKVISVTPLNDDAVIVLDGMDLKNVNLNVAVNALIGSMLKYGYIDEVQNSVLISVKNADAQKGFELQEKLANEVGTLLSANAFEGAVISQMVAEDERLRALADAHGISIGKAALINLLVEQNDQMLFEDVANLGINDISLLVSSRQANLQGVIVSGKANDSAYIGDEKAKAIALAHAEIDIADATFIKSYFDWDDGVAVYDVEFYSGNVEYDYEIDALTGLIREYDRDIDSYSIPQKSGSGGEKSNASSKSSDGYIGEETAKSTALSHAGFSVPDVERMRVELERDDGRMTYEVEFYKGGMEYQYEIDAVSGEVLEWEHELDD